MTSRQKCTSEMQTCVNREMVQTGSKLLRTEAVPGRVTVAFPALHPAVSMYSNSICIVWMNENGTIHSLWLYYIPAKCQRRRQWHPLQYSCLENPMDGGAW